MRGMRCGAVAAWALAAGLGAGAAPVENEIPPGMLMGRTLLLGGGSATAVAPGAFWKWSVLGSLEGDLPMDAFLCRNRISEGDSGYLLAVTRRSIAPLDDATVDAFVRKIGGSVRAGAALARPTWESSDIPFPGSYRFRYEVVTSRMTGYLFGYAGRRGRGFITQCLSLSPREPPEFTKFSASVYARMPPPVSKARVALAVSGLAVVLGFVLMAVKREG